MSYLRALWFMLKYAKHFWAVNQTMQRMAEWSRTHNNRMATFAVKWRDHIMSGEHMDVRKQAALFEEYREMCLDIFGSTRKNWNMYLEDIGKLHEHD